MEVATLIGGGITAAALLLTAGAYLTSGLFEDKD
jgi:hypothetical protein